ncbi:MAG: AsnC family transcriptional regulator [Archaeoglobaceae archaeon]
MDEKDRLIISLLQRNGRVSFSKIAEKVGMTAMGVKKRVERLLRGDVRIKAMVNVEKICLAILAIEVENADAINEILERFKNCPRILRFFVTVGGYNLFAIVFSEDYESLESITIENCSLRSQKGIRRFEVYPVQEVYYEPYLDIKVVAEKQDNPPCGVSCVDCRRFVHQKCLGCPAIKLYRGVL